MRYRVLDLPVKGVGAFTPIPNTNPIASSWGLVRVSGSPGTLPVPSPKPQDSWLPIPSTVPLTQPSNVAPDMFLPAVYVAYADNMGPAADGFGMATRRHNPLPVPAMSFIRAARVAFRGRRMGGRTVMAWPRAFQRYPLIGSKAAQQ